MTHRPQYALRADHAHHRQFRGARARPRRRRFGHPVELRRRPQVVEQLFLLSAMTPAAALDALALWAFAQAPPLPLCACIGLRRCRCWAAGVFGIGPSSRTRRRRAATRTRHRASGTATWSASSRPASCRGATPKHISGSRCRHGRMKAPPAWRRPWPSLSFVLRLASARSGRWFPTMKPSTTRWPKGCAHGGVMYRGHRRPQAAWVGVHLRHALQDIGAALAWRHRSVTLRARMLAVHLAGALAATCAPRGCCTRWPASVWGAQHAWAAAALYGVCTVARCPYDGLAVNGELLMNLSDRRRRLGGASEAAGAKHQRAWLWDLAAGALMGLAGTVQMAGLGHRARISVAGLHQRPRATGQRGVGASLRAGTARAAAWGAGLSAALGLLAAAYFAQRGICLGGRMALGRVVQSALHRRRPHAGATRPKRSGPAAARRGLAQRLAFLGRLARRPHGELPAPVATVPGCCGPPLAAGCVMHRGPLSLGTTSSSWTCRCAFWRRVPWGPCGCSAPRWVSALGAAAGTCSLRGLALSPAAHPRDVFDAADPDWPSGGGGSWPDISRACGVACSSGATRRCFTPTPIAERERASFL